MKPEAAKHMRVSIGVIRRLGPNATPLVLLQRRSPKAPWCPGLWEFPGGKATGVEGPWATLVRELREELGVEVTSARILAEYAYPVSDGIERAALITFWDVIAYKEEAQAQEALTMIGWVNAATLRQSLHLMTPGSRLLVERHREFFE